MKYLKRAEDILLTVKLNIFTVFYHSPNMSDKETY